MKNSSAVRQEKSVILKIYEKMLSAMIVLFAYFHMLGSTFMYVIDTSIIKRLELKFALVLAAAVIIYFLISLSFFRSNLKSIYCFICSSLNYEQLYLIFLSIWSFLSCRVNAVYYNTGFLQKNQLDLFDIFANAFVFFPLTRIMTKQRARKVIEAGFILVLFSYSVFTVYALKLLFHLDFNRYVSISETRLALKLGVHYNVTAAVSFLMLVMCLYFLVHRNKLLKIISALLIPIHLFVCQLTNSRTIFVSGLIILPLFMFFYILNRFENKSRRFKFITGVIAAGIVFGIYWFTRPLAFALFEKVTHYREVILNTADVLDPRLEGMRAFDDQLNGRELVWIACLKVMLHEPKNLFFGVTPNSVSAAMINIGGLTWDATHAHNMFLQIGVSYGVLPMIAYCVFMFLVCLRSLKLLLFPGSKSLRNLFIIPIMIFSLVIPSLVEVYIVRYQIPSSVFALAAGWELCLVENGEKEKI